MQIPFFNLDPKTCIQQCPNSWVVKLPTEAGQLLANGYSDLSKTQLTKKGNVRSNQNHIHHPIAKWVLESIGNWFWTLEFAIYGCEEKLIRYPTRPIHYHYPFLQWCLEHLPDLLDGFTKPYQMSGYEHLSLEISYQEYFNDQKQHLAKWSNREIPYWYRRI